MGSSCSRRDEVWGGGGRGDSRHAGPWLYTMRDGQAALALEAFDMEDLTVEGGEEVVFGGLDEMFPDNVAAHRMGEAMEEAFGLKTVKNETPRRARFLLSSRSTAAEALQGTRPASRHKTMFLGFGEEWWWWWGEGG